MTERKRVQTGAKRNAGPSAKTFHLGSVRSRRSLVVGSIVSAAVVAAGIVVTTIIRSSNRVSDTRQETPATAGGPASAQVTEPPVPPPEGSVSPLEPPALPPTPSFLSGESGRAPPEPTSPIPEPATPTPRLPALPDPSVGKSPEPAGEAAETGPAPRAAIEALEKEALDAVSQLIEALPMSSDPLALMGMVQVMFGNTAEGMQWWERCLEVNPKRPDVYDGLAHIAAEKGEYEKAVELWGKVLQIDSRSPGVRNNLARVLIDSGKMDEAIAVLEKEPEVSPEERSLSYFLLGKAYLQLREYEKAQESYEAAVATRPDYAGAWYGLATAHARLGHSEEARQSMDKFRTFRAADRDADTGRRRTRRDLASVRRLVAQAHTSVGVTYQAKGYLPRAEQHWQRAAELDPKNGMCRVQLAALYRNDAKYEKALPICEQLVEIDPTNAAFHLNLGILCAEMNRFHAALAEVQRAIDLEPDHPKHRRIYQQIQEMRQRDRQN